MCVIIHKKPGLMPTFENIQDACHVNAHGFGISVADRGQLTSTRVYNEKGNDPELVFKMMEDAKAQDVFVHLRYSTMGVKNEENCHPFPILTNEEHGLDVSFMHNGTLYDFKDPSGTLSDSNLFATQICKPLAETIWRASNTGLPLTDPLFKTIMEKYCGTTSKFLLFDGDGDTLIIDPGKVGAMFEWGWASNTYSFNRQHREPEKKTTYYSNTSTYTNSDDDYWNDYSGNDNKTYTKPQIVGPSTVGTTSVHQIIYREEPAVDTDDTSTKAMGHAIMTAKKKGAAFKNLVAPAARLTFCDIAELDTLEDVCIFDQLELEELVAEHPEAATLLLMDLLYELYQSKRTSESTAVVPVTTTEEKAA